MSTPVAAFSSRYPFTFDAFQTEALQALAIGESVLVAAPTGSGKTVVGEFAVWLALSEGGKAFYTTPLKALSNQKYGDLIALHGTDNVGLLTGDNSINAGAPIVVMTTEVLRNMIYERSDLMDNLRYVVLDEVHYLQDRYRGAVWEEVIIHLPLDIKIVSLSATVSNVEEFAAWIETLRGPTAAIIEEHRPVTLRQHYLIAEQLYPMFVGTDDPAPNNEILRIERRRQDPSSSSGDKRRNRRGAPRRFPRRADVVDLLDSQEMLPAIYFIFSRKGCDLAVGQCLREGVRLTDPSERAIIREIAERRTSYLEAEDLDVLGYGDWMEALEAGLSAHHAGLIPVFKETVEELFQKGLVKVVFATETLSLGINMPARTVVIESLTKFTGERHEVLTPGAFTQLTGRAGRRGIDVIGHAVIPQQRDITFQQIAGLASTRTYPLVSSFQPSYNMATNLVRNYSRDEAEHLLNSSFAQYHADKDVVVLERLIERNDAYLASYRQKMECHLGDFAEYWALKEKASSAARASAAGRVSAKREETRGILGSITPGQVLYSPGGRTKGPIVVLGRDRSKRGEPRIFAVTRSRRVLRLGPSDFPDVPVRVGNLNLGSNGRVGDTRTVDMETRRRLAAALAEMDVPYTAVSTTGSDESSPKEHHALLQHPCHRCDDRDRHAQWAERAARLERENTGLRKRVRTRTETLSRQFDKVVAVLEEFDCVEAFGLTEKGVLLSRIYNENDLLVVESLTRGWLDELTVPEMAAICSTFVFESRGPEEVGGTLPTSGTKRIFGKVVRQTERIQRSEHRVGLDLTRGVDPGFAEVVYRWAAGASLEEVLADGAYTPGDFIRSCKQTVDLLRQLGEASPSGPLRAVLREAADSVNKGVVAYTGLV